MDRNTPRAEAERWLGIAVKLLTARDFLGSKTFAIRARDSDPNNPLPDQILAVVETVLAGENRVNPSNHPDWYTVLQLPRLVRDPGLISDHYRRLTVLLNPESNRLPFADYSLQLVMDAWSVLSDPTKKWIFDNELSVYLQQHAPPPQPPPPQQPPVAAPENNQVNVFQFFQQAPPPQPPQQAVDVWQQQPEENQSYNQNYRQQSHHNSSNSNSNNNQLHQIEFLQPPQPQAAAPELRMYQAAEEVQMRQESAPQWQVRVPTPVRGERREDVAVSKVVTPPQSTQKPAQPMFMRQETEVVEMMSPTRTTQRPKPQLPGQQMFMRQEAEVAEVMSPTRTTQRPTPQLSGQQMFMRREAEVVPVVLSPTRTTQRPTPQLSGQQMFMRREAEVAPVVEMMSPTRTTQRPTPQLPGQQMFMRREAEVAPVVVEMMSPIRTAQRPTPQLQAQSMFMRQEAEVAPVVEVSRRQAPVSVQAAQLQPKPVVVPAKSVGMGSNIDVMMQPPPAVAPAKSVALANNVDVMMQPKPAVGQAKTVTATRNIDVMMQPSPAFFPAKSEALASNVDGMMKPQPAVVTAKSVGLASKVDVMMQQAPATVVPAKSVNVARSIDVTMQPAPAVVPAKTVTAARKIDVMVQPPVVTTATSNVDVMMQSPPVVIPSKSATLASNNDGNNSNAKSVGVGVVHESSNNDNDDDDDDEDVDIDLSHNDGDTASADENNDGGVEEEGECFWTSCPYCFYVYEYPKKYQNRTLRCQNCRRCFHGLRIPNPPSMGGSSGEKDKESPFRTWGCFPLGFSTAVWKNNNQMGKSSVASEWVPFTPMFAFPLQKGGGNFQWVSSNGGASIGPKNARRPTVARPRSYVNIDDDGFVSDASDSGSSDRDWRKNPALGKTIKKRKGNVGAVGRPKKDSLDLRNTQIIVLGLPAGVTEGARRRVVATRTSNQTKRKVKKMGRLDLNVEFNNEGDERAPRVRAANGEEDGIENIGFFEGLDEFFSTLPILNVGEEEKAKPA